MSLVSLYKKNADVLRLVVFTILRKSASDSEYKETPRETEIDSEKVFNKVKELFGLEYCPTWLKQSRIISPGLLAIYYIEAIICWDQLIKG